MIRVLSIVLVVQIALATALYWPRDMGEAPPGALVDALARDTISRITIRDGEDGTVTLSRTPDGWQLDSGLPADSARVAPLLDALLAVDPGFAIADSSTAADRFEVATDDFERRIELAGDGGSATVYLGTSPAFRKIHARRDGESAVYVIELNSYDAPAAESDWLDRTLLAGRDLTRIGLYGVDYVLEGDGWRRADGEPVDAAAMEELLQVLASLRVSGIEEAADEDLAAAGETLRIDLASGERASRLTVLDNPEAERYYLRSDRYEPVFGTSAYDAERLVDAARGAAGMAEDAEEAEDAGDDAADVGSAASEDDGIGGSDADPAAAPAAGVASEAARP